MKFIAIRKNNQIVRYETEDGKFTIRKNTGIGIGYNRWVINTTDGSTPFNGYKGKPNACGAEIVQTIADAKEAIKNYG